MEAEEALESIKQIFKERKGNLASLGKLEEKVFLLSWQGMNYSQMPSKIKRSNPTAKPYTEQYLKEIGKSLNDKIKRVLNIDDLDKRNLREELENFFERNYNYSTKKLSYTTAPEPDYTTSPELTNNTVSELNQNPFIPFSGRVEEKYLFFDREREIRRIFEVLNSGSGLILAIAFVTSAIAFAISEFAFVTSEFAFVTSGFAFVISGFAFVTSEFAFAISTIAFAIIEGLSSQTPRVECISQPITE